MRKSGMSFAEHYELGRNLRQMKEQVNSINRLLTTKFGATKRYTKQIERAGNCIDRVTDDMKNIVKKMDNPPPDIDNYYYKI